MAAAAAATCSMAARMREARPLRRRRANWQLHSWNYHAIHSFNPNSFLTNEAQTSHHKKLKDGVRELLLRQRPQEASARLRLVEMLRRLGLGRHFEEEIHDALIASFARAEATKFADLKGDLLSATTLFRLLRETGHSVSPDLLSCAFMDTKNKQSLRDSTQAEDVRGLLSLHEASHISFRGEELLDEARAFASERLQDLMPSLARRPGLRRRVACALELPLHWRAPRHEAACALEQYEQESDHSNEMMVSGCSSSVLRLARLDFDFVQAAHQGELARLTRWWMDAALWEKMPFARDRIVESYFLAMGLAFEPHLRECREAVTKIAALVAHLHDVYDFFGTAHELQLFTDAIGRWEEGAMEELPEYLRAIYRTILNTSHEIADGARKKQSYDGLPLFKKAWHDFCKALVVEARWRCGARKPPLEEYMSNGWVSCSGPLLLLHAFPMLDSATAHAMGQLESETYPRLLRLASNVFRLCDDAATRSAELERGDAPSAIACYMRDRGASERDGREAMEDVVAETWKDINEEAFSARRRSALPKPFAALCVNLARITHCIYHSGEGFGANQVERLLFQRIHCA